jgi:molybdenum cofactor cytidylyltransferase
MPPCAGSDPADAIAAIVLAAGFSSRMGAFKPLLPFGGRTVIGHVVASLREAGVRRIHVVTGHSALLLKMHLKSLGVKAVHNANYAEGMFTSVQAGVASLPAQVEGFLLLPADVPLVRVQTIQRVHAVAAGLDAAIVHPTFRGERGHPPYVGRALFGEILKSDGEGGLRAVLTRHDAEAVSVPVIDRGCLQDMDCVGDYRRALEALERQQAPDDEECEAMLEAAGTPEPVRRHCRKVGEMARCLAVILNKTGAQLNPCLAAAAGLVHDIAKGQPLHDEAGAALMRGFGFPAVADAVASHTTIVFDGSRVDEAAIVYLADKMFRGETRIRLEERFAPALARFADDPCALTGVKRRLADARAIMSAIDSRLGLSLDDPWQAVPPPDMQTEVSA